MSDEQLIADAKLGMVAFVMKFRQERISALLAASRTKKDVVLETVTTLDSRFVTVLGNDVADDATRLLALVRARSREQKAVIFVDTPSFHAEVLSVAKAIEQIVEPPYGDVFVSLVPGRLALAQYHEDVTISLLQKH